MGAKLKSRKRTEITIETDRVVVISGRRVSTRAVCKLCDAPMAEIELAARVARVGSRAIYRWIEAERIHFIESAEGALLVCLNSIPPADAPP